MNFYQEGIYEVVQGFKASKTSLQFHLRPATSWAASEQRWAARWCSALPTPGAQHPARGSSAWERRGAAGVGPEETTKMTEGRNPSAMQTKRVGGVQPGEEKPLTVSKEGYKTMILSHSWRVFQCWTSWVFLPEILMLPFSGLRMWTDARQEQSWEVSVSKPLSKPRRTREGTRYT